MSVNDLPVAPPVAPMLAKLGRELPRGDYLYEPKWDGFRCIVFRDGKDVLLASRNELVLTRYFPELIEVLKESLPERVVLDGEVVVAGRHGLDFDALSQRVHPAESRVRLLAGKTPASFVAFDLLALGGRDLRSESFALRRGALEALNLGRGGSQPPSVQLTPATRDVTVAEEWFERFEGAGLDGVVAKDLGLPYVEGKRVMVKLKHERTADFVVGGFRWYRAGRGDEVGSLMLGLYDSQGRLAHVGVIGAFPAEERRSLVPLLAPYRVGPGMGLEEHPWAFWAASPASSPGTPPSSSPVGSPHTPPATPPAPPAGPGGQRLPGARSRWNAKKDLSFEPLRPELVVEAAYEHLQGHRLRHTAQFRRWRPERRPESCTYDQLEVAVPYLLEDIFGVGADSTGGAAPRP